jgi:hypothetical protein
MPQARSNQALNEVLVILDRSLPMYLSDATPWVAYGKEEAKQVLDRIVADDREHVALLTTLLDARRHTIDRGEFPMDFTSLHDLSLGFLIKELIEHQRRDAHAIESRLGRLAGDPEGNALTTKILASARRHLESLESLPRQPASPAERQAISDVV